MPLSIFDKYYSRNDTIDLLGEVAGRRVLDVGCGPGLYAADLVERGAQVTGLDIDPLVIAAAGRRLAGRGDFIVADLAAPLDFLTSNSVDLVLASLVMHYLPDWSIPLAEFRRVLVPGGRWVMSVHHPFADQLESSGDDYWTTEEWSSPMHGGGHEKFWRRSLEKTFTTLTAAGLTIDGLREPETAAEIADARLAGIPRLLILSGTTRG